MQTWHFRWYFSNHLTSHNMLPWTILTFSFKVNIVTFALTPEFSSSYQTKKKFVPLSTSTTTWHLSQNCSNKRSSPMGWLPQHQQQHPGKEDTRVNKPHSAQLGVVIKGESYRHGTLHFDERRIKDGIHLWSIPGSCAAWSFPIAISTKMGGCLFGFFLFSSSRGFHRSNWEGLRFHTHRTRSGLKDICEAPTGLPMITYLRWESKLLV